jgi:hypothetical protein
MKRRNQFPKRILGLVVNQMTNSKVVVKPDNEMTEAHEAHLEQIKLATCDLLDRKYRAGQKNHGGSLWSMPAARQVENAIEEATDQMTYLLSLRQSMRIIMELAHEGMNDDSVCATTARENCRAIWFTITGHEK